MLKKTFSDPLQLREGFGVTQRGGIQQCFAMFRECQAELPTDLAAFGLCRRDVMSAYQRNQERML